MNDWREVVGKAVSEARSILKKEGWPSDLATLKEGHRSGSIAAVMAARAIAFAEQLEDAVRDGNTEAALNLFLELISSAEEARYTAKIPELNGWLIGDITSDIYKTINHGLTYRRTQTRRVTTRNQERAKARASEWNRWNSVAARISMTNPNLSKIEKARLVKRKLDLTEHPDAIARRLR